MRGKYKYQIKQSVLDNACNLKIKYLYENKSAYWVWHLSTLQYVFKKFTVYIWKYKKVKISSIFSSTEIYSTIFCYLPVFPVPVATLFKNCLIQTAMKRMFLDAYDKKLFYTIIKSESYKDNVLLLSRFNKTFILEGLSIILKCNHFYISNSF